MAIRAKVRRAARKAANPVFSRVAPLWWKEYNELRYWRLRQRDEGVLAHDHYKTFYTDHFGLSDHDYQDKVVLDIGCGPRGSLEWATMAKRTIGIDPLAKEYLRLGADRHRMEYFDSPCENIELADGACDIVCSFNSLDHVEDVEQSLQERKRVTRSGGTFLLVVEINHAPTPTEPHTISTDIVDQLKPDFLPVSVQVFPFGLDETGRPIGCYDSLQTLAPFEDPYTVTEKAYLCARLLRA